MQTKPLLAIVLSLFFTGCAGHNYSVSVNAISAQQANAQNNTTCFLLPLNDTIAKDELAFKEYSSFIAKGLREKNYKITSIPSDADLAVFIGYAISEPNTQTTTFQMPIYGQTGYSSSQTVGSYNSYSGTYYGSTSYTPTYGITGYTPVTTTTTYFTRALVVYAYEIMKQNEEVKLGSQAWKTECFSTGTSGDLREVMPYLAAAAKDYLCQNTGKALQLTINANDKSIVEFTGIHP